jgi:tetratricopeptide (TPR) repeat protein
MMVCSLLVVVAWEGKVLAQGILEEATHLSKEVNQLYQKGRYREAIPMAERALAIREKALGPDHPDVALSLNNLAELHRTIGDYGLAKPLYQRALTIWEKALGLGCRTF